MEGRDGKTDCLGRGGVQLVRRYVSEDRRYIIGGL